MVKPEKFYHLLVYHFTVPLKSVLNLVNPNSYMTKIDYRMHIIILSRFYLNAKSFWNLFCKESFLNSLFYLMDRALVLENLLNYWNPH